MARLTCQGGRKGVHTGGGGTAGTVTVGAGVTEVNRKVGTAGATVASTTGGLGGRATGVAGRGGAGGTGTSGAGGGGGNRGGGGGGALARLVSVVPGRAATPKLATSIFPLSPALTGVKRPYQFAQDGRTAGRMGI